jgi:1-acyl-sn-glycerol-3-phosphate acyltransferase
MLSFLPSCLLGVVSVLLASLNTFVFTIPLYILALLKFLIRLPAWQRLCARMLMGTIHWWIKGVLLVLKLTQRIEWDVEGTEGLSLDEWYFVNSNHQAWADIIVLLKIFTGRIPFPKFFLKRELFWIPILGTAWWALDYPFMKRYSKEFLEQHPELYGTDLETTRTMCERYKQTPVSILNFIEGTRFTPEKQRKQRSPYRHLLRPRAGGFAFAVGAMAGRITTMLDVTIVYPDGPATFWDFLCGRVSRIVARVKKRTIPREFVEGNYQDDPGFRRRFQEWVDRLWYEKDELIDSLLKKYGTDPASTGQGS